MLGLLAVEPLHDAVDVKAVGAGAPDQGTIVAGQFAVRTAAVEGDAANAASVVVGDPLPGGHAVPTPDPDAQPGLGLGQ